MTPRRAFRLKAVLFDFDGTLTLPGALDFDAIRRAIGGPPGTPLLEHIRTIPDAADRDRADRMLARFEDDAAAASQPDPAATAVIAELRRRGLAVGIVTRNRLQSVHRSLENFPGLGPHEFDVIVHRDVPVLPKPAPDGLAHAADLLGVDPTELMIVGDHQLDIVAGAAAGATTVHLVRPGSPSAPPLSLPEMQDPAEPDFVVSSLAEVPAIARLGLPLGPGKFPNDLLEEYLSELRFADDSVLVKPRVGEDIAALDVSDERILVLKSDPITFVTDSIGPYLVMVNANDVATSGAVPRWLLATLLFPPGETPSSVFATLHELRETCERFEIQLCGGHIEITDSVTRPIISGMMAGTLADPGLIDKQAMRTGDRILFSKAVAVEGTSILARELGDALLERGMTAREIEDCRAFLDKLGILTEARIAGEHPGVTAMHDVTEGGLATALFELSAAGGHRVKVDRGRIPVYRETERVCSLLGLDPLGLIGSGSLLITCAPAHADDLRRAIEAAGVEVTDIGEVGEPGRGVEAFLDGRSIPWPTFEVDELARLFT